MFQWFPLEGKNPEGWAKSQVNSKEEPEVEELPPLVPFAHHASMFQPIFPMLLQAIKVPIVIQNLKNNISTNKDLNHNINLQIKGKNYLKFFVFVVNL
jgi:hypothetical protein